MLNRTESAALQAALTPDETARLQAILLELLAGQIRLYTAGQSTTVRAETAQQLLASVSCALGLPGQSRALLAAQNPAAALEAGRRRLRVRWALAMRLCEAACRTAPPCRNLALQETLHSIAAARGRYDVRFAAHEPPCSLDYPLCVILPDDPPGPEYLVAYLRQIIAENRILSLLEPWRVRELLVRCCPDYQGQLVNLCEPAAVNLLGRAALGLDPLPLFVTPAHREALARLRGPRFHAAADRLAGQYGMDGPTLHAVADRLAARVPQGGLEAVFL